MNNEIDMNVIKEHIKNHLKEMADVDLGENRVSELTNRIIEFLKSDFDKENLDTETTMFLITEIFFVEPEQSMFNESKNFNDYEGFRNRGNLN